MSRTLTRHELRKFMRLLVVIMRRHKCHRAMRHNILSMIDALYE